MLGVASVRLVTRGNRVLAADLLVSTFRDQLATAVTSKAAPGRVFRRTLSLVVASDPVRIEALLRPTLVRLPDHSVFTAHT
jgi:hypothetical protein